VCIEKLQYLKTLRQETASHEKTLWKKKKSVTEAQLIKCHEEYQTCFQRDQSNKKKPEGKGRTKSEKVLCLVFCVEHEVKQF